MTLLILSLVLLGIIILLAVSVSRITETHLASVQSEAGEGVSTVQKPSGIGVATHLGGDYETPVKPPDVETKEIAAKYGISYASRIYVDEVFSLQVHLTGQDMALTVKEGDQVVASGLLTFTHKWYPEISEEEPLPKIQVDLKFADGDFQASSKSQTKELAPDVETIFSFQVKPLKSTDLLLQVEVAYLGVKWKPETITEIAVATDDRRETTTVTKTPAVYEADRQILLSEDLIVQVKSFLNMNAAALSKFSKIVAVILTLIYVGIVIYTGQTDSTLGTIAVGITAIAGIFGIPLTNAFKDAQIRNEASE